MKREVSNQRSVDGSDPNFPSDASCNSSTTAQLKWMPELMHHLLKLRAELQQARDAKLFWLLFPKTCKILQVCQGSKLKGVQDSCFQVRFVFFLGNTGKMESISGFGNATFIITTT